MGIKFLSLTLLLVLLVGCAPGLGKTIPVTRFPDPQSLLLFRNEVGRVAVRPILDNRSDPTVAEVDGRRVQPDGDVGSAVRAALENYLKFAGFGIGASSDPSVSGSIELWSARVYPGFPTSQVEAAATLNLVVSSREGAEKFRGTYKGEYTIQHPLLDEDKIAEALGQAMAAAIQEALQDPRFTVPIS